MTTEEETLKAAVTAVETATAARNGTDPNRITLHSGIILECRAVPPLYLRHVGSQIKRPEVPITFIEEKQREEENPNDPKYIEATQQWLIDVDKASRNVFLLAGTKTVHVPDSAYKDEDPTWHEELKETSEVLGIETPSFEWENQAQRRLAWLCYYALSSAAELNNVLRTVARLSGVAEGDVAQVAESFRGGEERGTNPEPADAVGGEDGDNVPEALRGSGSGNGGA